MITVELDNFSLKEICQSGQCFRMYETEENTYELIAGDKYLKMTQEGSIVNFYCSDMEFICYWVPYFDIDADYSSYIAKINPRDTYLMAAAECGNGIRILQQDLWEMIITFLISQQNNISRIRGCVERLCEAYGEKKSPAKRNITHFRPRSSLQAYLKKIYVNWEWDTGHVILRRRLEVFWTERFRWSESTDSVIIAVRSRSL